MCPHVSTRMCVMFEPIVSVIILKWVRDAERKNHLFGFGHIETEWLGRKSESGEERWSNTKRIERERVTKRSYIFKCVVCVFGLLCVFYYKIVCHLIYYVNFRHKKWLCLAQILSLMFHQVPHCLKLLLKMGWNLPVSNFPGMKCQSVCTDSTPDVYEAAARSHLLCVKSQSANFT